ncbi:hypothetical protein CR513_03225, partial [Mucuna pruriens]
MGVLDNGEIESESSSDDEMPPLEDCSDVEVVELVNGDILVLRLCAKSMPSDMWQCEHNFHTRCHINYKVCSMIIDRGSCTNVATIIVEKINLQIAKHTRPYKLQWRSNIGEVKVDKQVAVPFAIENYKDEVLCDLVHMEAGHIPLSRPWQLDRKMTHNVDSLLQEFTNVFPYEVPHGLPSLRGIEHQIYLVPSFSILNRPTYRTNPKETKEIQKQVNELLQKGFMRESLSPCSAPVILVPKKDGTWHMYVDSQAINKITIKYRFSIPSLEIAFGFIGEKKGFLLKERFPAQRKVSYSKKIQVEPRGDGTFQVLERIDDNAYKLDLSTAYGEEFDSMTNPFEEGRNDRNPTDKDKDHLYDIRGPMTRSKTKMRKQYLQGLCLGIKESLK